MMRINPLRMRRGYSYIVFFVCAILLYYLVSNTHRRKLVSDEKRSDVKLEADTERKHNMEGRVQMDREQDLDFNSGNNAHDIVKQVDGASDADGGVHVDGAPNVDGALHVDGAPADRASDVDDPSDVDEGRKPIREPPSEGEMSPIPGLPSSRPDYLPNYRNPCWHVPAHQHTFNLSNEMCHDRNCKKIFKEGQDALKEENTLLRCLPSFFLIGPQKCGTTDLYDSLMLHPHMAGGIMKEPHYWAWKQPHGTSLDEYIDLYHTSANKIEKIEVENFHPVITGDGSATTIWNNWEWSIAHPEHKSLPPHRIHSLIPQAKILAIVRDPIKRLLSDYLYFGHSDVKKFETKVLEGLDWLEECYARHNRSHCIYTRMEGASSFGWDWTPAIRIRLGLYVEFLEDWLSVFSPKQVHVELLDDYSEDKLPVLNRIFNFLGLDDMPESAVKALEVRSSKIHNAVKPKTYTSFGKVNDTVLDRLHKFYDPFNRKLSLLLNRKLPWGCVYVEC